VSDKVATTTSTSLGRVTAPTVPALPVTISAVTASTLFASLVPIERAIADPATPIAKLIELGAIEQRDDASLADHPAWIDALPADTPDQARKAIRADSTADRELGSVPGPVAKTIPRWEILNPRPATELLYDYQAAATATGVPWSVLAAIHLVESRMGRIRGLSGAGAQGPMQFLPTTWASFGAGGDIWSDHDAILAAGRFLHQYGAPRDLARAVFRYNPSAHYVNAVLAYASVMGANPRAYYAYYGWRVYVATSDGEFLLPEGYGRRP
jgi:membrane-bound lytic murein transglycosylase B